MDTQTVKTTVELYTDVWKDLKLEALERGLPVKYIINESLRQCRVIKVTPRKKRVSNIKIGGHHLGNIVGSLHRRDIYDWL